MGEENLSAIVIRFTITQHKIPKLLSRMLHFLRLMAMICVLHKTTFSSSSSLRLLSMLRIFFV